MKFTTTELPQPDQLALAHSQRVTKYVCAQIKQKGPLSFHEYMNTVLYAPGLGYYVSGARKFGQAGDFVTAPEITPIFPHCLANCVVKHFVELPPAACILEFGPGTGKLAGGLMEALATQNQLPEQYYLLELSPDLRQRQQEYLYETLPQHYSRFCWLDRLPQAPLNAVVIANEVLDAMPVHRFCITEENKPKMYCVDVRGGELVWSLQEIHDSSLLQAVENIGIEKTSLPYVSEMNLMLSGWFSSLAACLREGAVILIDYGFPRHEYYHPQRSMGTLMCHYRHHSHGDPLVYPGIQDITAHVDFDAVSEAAIAHGFQVLDYTNQANFLMDHHVLDIAERWQQQGNSAVSSALKTLLMPSEMGELFKVLQLTKSM